MKTYLFDICFNQTHPYLSQPLRMLQEANTLEEAWKEVLEFEYLVWGPALVSITYIGEQVD